jgi:lysophospholipase L1-like esterase
MAALAFAVLGVVFLFRGFAATYTSAEAETGTISGKAAKVDDTAASAGKAVKFGSTGTVPSGVVKIMPLGSSTIDGGGSSSDAGFRPELYQVLTQQEGMNVDFVGSRQNGPTTNFDRDHEGHGGWKIGTGDGDKDLSREVVGWLNTYKPDIIIFYAGFNDIGDATGAETAARFDAIAAKIFNTLPKVRLIAGTTMVPFDYPSSHQNQIRQYNAGMEPVAAKYRSQGRFLQIVDINGVITKDDHSDSVHANDSGYHKMVPVWLAGIRATYPTF